MKINIKRITILFILIVLLTPYSAFPSSITNNITSLCEKKPIILISEHHKQPQSQQLFIELVQHYFKQNKVLVALEIPLNEQASLNATLAGGTDFSFISSIIDHPAYREMIHTLGKMGVDVVAIDSDEKGVNRDDAMARNVLKNVHTGQYERILVLVGNSHVIENIQWHKDLYLRMDHRYLAEPLVDAGHDPCSIYQMFRNEGGEPDFVKKGDDLYLKTAMEVIQNVNHGEDENGSEVGDGIVIWN